MNESGEDAGLPLSIFLLWNTIQKAEAGILLELIEFNITEVKSHKPS